MGMTIDADELLKAMDTWDKFGNNPNVGLIVLRTPVLQDRYVPYVKYDDMVKCVKGMPTVEAIPKADYENHLKADMVAMLDMLRAEIEQLPTSTCTETCRIYIDADDFKGNVLEIFDKYKAESGDKDG